MTKLTRSAGVLFSACLSLVLLVACGGDSSTGPEPDPGEEGPTTGALTVQVSTQGDSPDPDGYAVAVDGGSAQDVEANDTLTVGGLSEGSHDITVQQAASNCTPPEDASGSVTAGDSTVVSVSVQCEASLQDRIVFYSERNSTNGDVFTMNPDGSNPTELTGQTIAPWDITDDGTGVVGIINPNGSTSDYEIAVIRPDGSVNQLTSNTKVDAYPRFGPGDSTIVFVREDSTGRGVYQMDRSGGNIQQVIGSAPDLQTADISPADGQLVAGVYDSTSSSLDLHGFDASGGNETVLYSDTTDTRLPVYSPSGNRVAFEDATNDRMRVMNPDGTGVQTVLTGSGSFLPRWTAGGEALLYGQDNDVYRINPDGSGEINLTAHSELDAFAVQAQWSSGNN